MAPLEQIAMLMFVDTEELIINNFNYLSEEAILTRLTFNSYHVKLLIDFSKYNLYVCSTE
jgi:hypothetical protein